MQRISAGIPREIAEIEALMREEGLGMHNRRPDVLDWLRDPASSPQP